MTATSTKDQTADATTGTVRAGTDTTSPPVSEIHPGGGAGILWGMDTSEILTCEVCGAREGEHLDPLSDPEFCECCDQTLCERCWTEQHVRILS